LLARRASRAGDALLAGQGRFSSGGGVRSSPGWLSVKKTRPLSNVRIPPSRIVRFPGAVCPGQGHSKLRGPVRSQGIRSLRPFRMAPRSRRRGQLAQPPSRFRPRRPCQEVPRNSRPERFGVSPVRGSADAPATTTPKGHRAERFSRSQRRIQPHHPQPNVPKDYSARAVRPSPARTGPASDDKRS